MLRILIRYFIIACSTLLLIACSRPSIEDIEPHIRPHFQFALDEGIFEVKNMKFMDGDSAAAESYIAKIEFDVVFLKNMKDVTSHARRHAAATPVETFHRNQELFNLMTTFGRPKANTTVHVKADVVMQEKDDTWHASLISIFPQ